MFHGCCVVWDNHKMSTSNGRLIAPCGITNTAPKAIPVWYNRRKISVDGLREFPIFFFYLICPLCKHHSFTKTVERKSNLSLVIGLFILLKGIKSSREKW
jgi:hypothetical protein